jgi:hypothetical protein
LSEADKQLIKYKQTKYYAKEPEYQSENSKETAIH